MELADLNDIQPGWVACCSESEGERAKWDSESFRAAVGGHTGGGVKVLVWVKEDDKLFGHTRHITRGHHSPRAGGRLEFKYDPSEEVWVQNARQERGISSGKGKAGTGLVGRGDLDDNITILPFVDMHGLWDIQALDEFLQRELRAFILDALDPGRRLVGRHFMDHKETAEDGDEEVLRGAQGALVKKVWSSRPSCSVARFPITIRVKYGIYCMLLDENKLW